MLPLPKAFQVGEVQLLDIFVNDLGKMGVNLVVVEDTKLFREPSFLDCLQSCQRFL